MVVLKEGVCREEIVGGGRSLNLPAGTYFPSTPKLNNESCVSEKKEVNLWNLPLVQRIHENIFIPSPRIKKKKEFLFHTIKNGCVVTPPFCRADHHTTV